MLRVQTVALGCRTAVSWAFVMVAGTVGVVHSVYGFTGTVCRLPFDEAQIEIPDGDKSGDEQPQGFINNNPPKNNPIINGKSGAAGKSSGRKAANKVAEVPRRQGSPRRNKNKPKPNNNSRRPAGKKGGSRSSSQSAGGGSCPGGDVSACVSACEAVSLLKAYTACVKQCVLIFGFHLLLFSQ